MKTMMKADVLCKPSREEERRQSQTDILLPWGGGGSEHGECRRVTVRGCWGEFAKGLAGKGEGGRGGQVMRGGCVGNGLGWGEGGRELTATERKR